MRDLARRRAGPSALLAALVTLAAAHVTAQVRVSVRGSGSAAAAMRRQIERLGAPATCVDAMQTLWRIGPPAAPLLAAAVEEGGAAAEHALEVLVAIGGEAAPAAPVLERAAAAAPANSARQRRLREAAARIGGPECILASRYQGDEVVQLDLAGKVQRRVAVSSPWGAWPAPDDELHAICYPAGDVLRLAWDGATRGKEHVVAMLTAYHRLPNGDRITSNWENDGVLRRSSADGEERWHWEKRLDVTRFAVVCGRIYCARRKPPGLLVVSLEGEVLTEIELDVAPTHPRLLRTGNLLVGCGKRILELDPEGKLLHEIPAPTALADVVRLADGRLVVSGKDGVFLLEEDGTVVWEQRDLGYCGPLFVRAR